MGLYLNSRTAYTLFRNEVEQPYFVDKTRMLKELFGFVKAGNKHICLTRPRRFGKTIAANMIAAFFSKGCDSKEVFDRLAISGAKEYDSFRNRFDVVHIPFNDVPRNCRSYEEYIGRIEDRPYVRFAYMTGILDFRMRKWICFMKDTVKVGKSRFL